MVSEQPDSPPLITPQDSNTEPKTAYFLSLTVSELRCFGNEPQTLNLSCADNKPARWTLILGNNGTGKTTLLQVLSILGFPGDKHLSQVHPLTRRAPLAQMTKDNSHQATAIAQMKISQALECLEESENGRLEADFNHLGLSRYYKSGIFPVCIGYGASRQMALSQLTNTVDLGPSASLFDNSVFLRNAEEWLMKLDYAASKAEPKTQREKRLNSRLEQVCKILIDLLPDVSDIRFSLPDEDTAPRVEFQTPFGWLPLQGIAYGYQSLIGWCVDLASHMVDQYPDSPDPLAEPAVVLIDEIELHLHPSWQRDLMGFLTEKFPNVQFIATAHSPLVVQAASSVNANIVLLEREGDRVIIRNDIESVRGWRIDQILSSDLYGTAPRSPDIQAMIEERRKLLGKSKLTKKDKQRLDQLNLEIGPLTPGESPEDIKTAQLLRKSLDLMQAKIKTDPEST